jgi:hypothetical protein
VSGLLSCQPVIPFAGDHELGRLCRMPDGRFAAADPFIAVAAAWVAEVDAGLHPWASVRRSMPGITFGAALRLAPPSGPPLVYQFVGYRGPKSQAWLCERMWD